MWIIDFSRATFHGAILLLCSHLLGKVGCCWALFPRPPPKTAFEGWMVQLHADRHENCCCIFGEKAAARKSCSKAVKKPQQGKQKHIYPSSEPLNAAVVLITCPVDVVCRGGGGRLQLQLTSKCIFLCLGWGQQLGRNGGNGGNPDLIFGQLKCIFHKHFRRLFRSNCEACPSDVWACLEIEPAATSKHFTKNVNFSRKETTNGRNILLNNKIDNLVKTPIDYKNHLRCQDVSALRLTSAEFGAKPMEFPGFPAEFQ